ncbi:MAG: DUF4349 domain-containing protein [Flavobacteriales bacterium]
MKLLVTFLLMIALACNDSSKHKSLLSQGESPVFESPEMIEDVIESTEIEDAKPKQIEQKIIKTAHLVFETNDLNKTYQQILNLVNQQQGFIQTNSQAKNYNQIRRTLVIRVPTQNFNTLLEGISKGVEFFDQKEISRKDVSEEFVDLTARIKAKKELEKRYLELLKKAKNVKEMLEIERELSNIREEIEAKQGRLQYLQNRVSLSTLHIEFYKTTQVKGTSLSYGQKIINALKGGWNGISIFFLGILYLWPLILIAIIVIWLLRRYLNKRKNK